MNVVKRSVADTAPETEGDLSFFGILFKQSSGGDRRVHNCHGAGSNKRK